MPTKVGTKPGRKAQILMVPYSLRSLTRILRVKQPLRVQNASEPSDYSQGSPRWHQDLAGTHFMHETDQTPREGRKGRYLQMDTNLATPA